MPFSKRLNLLASLVKDGANVYDVGADHGQLEILLASRVNKIIAIENKKGPYENLLVATKNLPNVQCYLASDLDKLDEESNFLILAGLGSKTIINIIKKNLLKIKTHNGKITGFSSIGKLIKNVFGSFCINHRKLRKISLKIFQIFDSVYADDFDNTEDYIE